MQHLHIYARLSHSYVTGWKNLDRHVFVCSLKLTPPRIVEVDDEGDYVSTTTGRVTAKALAEARKVWREIPRDVRVADFRRWFAGAVASEFDQGCRCEHDCCGHYQSYGVGHLEGRTVTVRIRSYRNI